MKQTPIENLSKTALEILLALQLTYPNPQTSDELLETINKHKLYEIPIENLLRIVSGKNDN